MTSINRVAGNPKAVGRRSLYLGERVKLSRRLRERVLLLVTLHNLACAAMLPAMAATDGLPFPIIERFENFTLKDGIPSHKVHCVLRASDGKLWAGTYKGVVVRQDGKFARIGIEDGLSHPMVLCMVEDPHNADMC